MQTDAELATALRQVKTSGLIPEAHIRLGVLADEARWIGQQTHALFPSAVELVVELNRRTNLSVMCASNAQEPGGMSRTPTRCSPYAVPKTMAPSPESSTAPDNESSRRQRKSPLKIEE